MPSNAKKITERIARLIELPSVSSVSSDFDMSNRPVIDQLADELERSSFEISVIEVPGKPGKANLIARMGSGEGGLVLSGHTDTVPCDESLWSSDPFRVTETNHRLYGLGTADMKSFLALAMTAAEAFEARSLHAPLTILATADEESTMSGVRALVEQGELRAQCAVIGEPTDLQPVRTHKGIMMEAIRIRGRSGHSSNPALGNNALEGMHRVIGDLLAWREQLQSRHRNMAFEVPVPTLNLGRIVGGDNPNRICGACELHIDLRPTPGLGRAELRDALRTRLANTLDGSGLDWELQTLFDGVDPMDTPADAAVVRYSEKLTGKEATGVCFATEAPYLSQLGMDVVVLGPGSIDQAHQPDEYLPLDQIEPTVVLLQNLIQRFCAEAA